MPLKRTTHWATQELDAYLRANADVPFVWGKHDCALFAANGIEAFTGTDIAVDFRGKYSDEASAFALIKTVTGGSGIADAAAWCAAKFGLPELLHDGKPAPLLAQRGDLVVMANPGGTGDAAQVAGLVHLNGRCGVTVGEEGLLQLPLSSFVRAWRVG